MHYHRSSMSQLSRKGPYKVWTGYKTMRVPEEIFNDVKNFMERRKAEYLAEQHGIELSEDELPHTPLYSLPQGTTKEQITDIIRETIRRELTNVSPIPAGEGGIPPPKLSASEKVFNLMKENPDTPLTTIQIERALNIPASTARQITRELAEQYENVEKIEGRPNKFVYHS